VQQNHLATDDREDHARNASSGKIAAHFPETVSERTAIGHSDWPAELYFLNILPDDATVISRKLK
jgi:hypothetical protein